MADVLAHRRRIVTHINENLRMKAITKQKKKISRITRICR